MAPRDSQGRPLEADQRVELTSFDHGLNSSQVAHGARGTVIKAYRTSVDVQLDGRVAAIPGTWGRHSTGEPRVDRIPGHCLTILEEAP